MKIILTSDVKKLGKKGDVVDVADGYGRNFLVKQKLGVEATKRSMEILDRENLQHELEEKELESKAKEVAKQLERITLEFTLKTGKGGKVFGGISTKQIMEQLHKQYHIQIDKRKVIDTGHISSLGFSNIRIDLYKNKVIGTIKVHVQEQ